MSRLWLAMALICAALFPMSARALDQGEAAVEALQQIQDDCAKAAPAYGPTIKPETIKWIVGPTSVNVSGQCYFNDGRYQGYYSANRSFAAKCSARPDEMTWKGGGSTGLDSVCSNGCAYSGSLYAQSPTGRLFTPTGAICSTNDHPAPTTPDPGEGGGDGGGTGPGDGGGEGGGDGGGDGDGGTGPGGGDGGGTGPGDGDGGGTGPGDGDGGGTGPGPGEGGDGGGTGPTTGRLYKKSGKTVQKVLAEFKTAIEGAPILSKVKGFFGSCTGGGSCPTATWDGGQYAGKFDLGSLCSGPLLQLFQYAGFVFLAGMGVVALRWALL